MGVNVTYTGLRGKGPHPKEQELATLAAKNGLVLEQFETQDGDYCRATFAVYADTPGMGNTPRAKVAVDAATVEELVGWVERYGKGEAF